MSQPWIRAAAGRWCCRRHSVCRAALIRARDPRSGQSLHRALPARPARPALLAAVPPCVASGQRLPLRGPLRNQRLAQPPQKRERGSERLHSRLRRLSPQVRLPPWSARPGPQLQTRRECLFSEGTFGRVYECVGRPKRIPKSVSVM